MCSVLSLTWCWPGEGQSFEQSHLLWSCVLRLPALLGGSFRLRRRNQRLNIRVWAVNPSGDISRPLWEPHRKRSCLICECTAHPTLIVHHMKERSTLHATSHVLLCSLVLACMPVLVSHEDP